VMPAQIMDFLCPEEGGVFVDCTTGEGGHSEMILNLSDKSRIICLDLDLNMLHKAKERLSKFEGRTTFVHANFCDINKAMELAQTTLVKGILMDLGISMAHIKGEERGITFAHDQPLDMRLDSMVGSPASYYVNKLKFEELAKVISDFSEERFAGRIARAITESRQKNRIETTTQLVEIISKVVPKTGKINPATRTFQALRILVNSELENLHEALPKCLRYLCGGGVLVAISYHSLEDRIVKNAFKDADPNSFEILTKKPLEANEDEVAENPASRSAKLRAIRRKIG
jgi:16S rRNA (cytosine1402-N4)-methyltransferase